MFIKNKEIFCSKDKLEKRKAYLELTNPNANISIRTLSDGAFELEYYTNEEQENKGYTIKDIAKNFNGFREFDVHLINALDDSIDSMMYTELKLIETALVMEFSIDFMAKSIDIKLLIY